MTGNSSKHTFRSVQCARYAARSVGLTAVPVIQGMAAVLTTATRLLKCQASANQQTLQATMLGPHEGGPAKAFSGLQTRPQWSTPCRGVEHLPLLLGDNKRSTTAD